ncbi:MAG: HEAT repeat domain-containing protein, partial [Planctomycetota bacterium]
LGRDDMLYRLHRDKHERVLPGTEKNGNPIVFRAYKLPWDQFDFRAYPKGSWVLHMLRSRLGEDLYRKAIRLYLERHALSSVVTDDLRQAFEEVSGKPFDAFFDQWVYQGGVPKLKVRHKWLATEGLLRVSVEQDKPTEGRQLFTFSVTLRCHAGDEVVDRRVEVTEAEHEFYVPLAGKPDVVRFDPEYTLLAEVDHKQSVEMLEAQLELPDDTIGRVLAAEALGEEDSQAAITALAEALSNDAFYGVRIAASKSLGKMSKDEALVALLTSLDQPDARVRNRVVKDVGKFYDDRAKAALLRVASNEPNPDIRASALGGLVKYFGSEIDRLLVDAVQGDSFQNQLAISAGKVIGRRHDPALADPLLIALRVRRNELPGRRYGEVLVSLAKAARDAEKTTSTREFLASRLNDPSIGVRLGAIEALGELGDRRATPLLEDLAKKSDKEGDAAEKALKRLDAQREPAAKTIKELRDQLRELREAQDSLQKSVEAIESKAEATEP